ncbi:ATP-dependent protease La [Xylaria sp. CBS 124048]|nr:ATP-dependent protease La [Xylaria sp. CBS 124048]
MSSSSPQSATLPLLPLTHGMILFPGSLLRIPVSLSRPDIPALLSNVYTRASGESKRVDQIPIACVPLNPLQPGPRDQVLAGGNREEQNEQLKASKSLPKSRLFDYGVTAKITGIHSHTGAEFIILVQGLSRISLDEVTQEQPFFEGKVTTHAEAVSGAIDSVEYQKTFQTLKRSSLECIAYQKLAIMLPNVAGRLNSVIATRLERFIIKKKPAEGGLLADYMVNFLENATYEDRLHVLAAVDAIPRMQRALVLIRRETSLVQDSINKTMLASPVVSIITDRRDIEAMKRNLQNLKQGGEQGMDEVDVLWKKIENAKLPPYAAEIAGRELNRLKRMPAAHFEYHITLTYLQTLVEIPWSVVTNGVIDAASIQAARKQLDIDHYGLEHVKTRILSYLTTVRLMQSINARADTQVKGAGQKDIDDNTLLESGLEDGRTGVEGNKRRVEKVPILLLIGPPGVGKTSIAQSIATALGRKFHRISLGGVRDEAEIRGHRRTYIAAMPGLIVQGLKKVGVANPVFLLDEIDKVSGLSTQGDPAAALLEVLDPEQNHAFNDHYVNVPIDLSKVLFIATANTTARINGPLLDRMETLEFPGYTTLEKRHIAQRHLIPKQIQVNGLREDQVHFSDAVVNKIIESYTLEPGVRSLEREIGSVCRAKAVEYVNASDGGALETYRADLTVKDVESILGLAKFQLELVEKNSQPGRVMGLSAYSFGGIGSVMPIEVLDMPGDGTVEVTGNLSSVFQESIKVARSWVRNHAHELGLTKGPAENIMKGRHLHVHCPDGAIRKDGPSSGMPQVVALVSLFSGQPVPSTIAMTGELRLSGHVRVVGGIKEKLIGAYRAGIKTVVLPAANARDTQLLPAEVLSGLKIIYVSHVLEALRAVWPEGPWAHEANLPPLQSHL